jgi:hypothetical protein
MFTSSSACLKQTQTHSVGEAMKNTETLYISLPQGCHVEKYFWVQPRSHRSLHCQLADSATLSLILTSATIIIAIIIIILNN